MSVTFDQKLCWSCEETVHADVCICPFCRADLSRQVSTHSSDALSPPYRLVNAIPEKPLAHTPLYSPQQEVNGNQEYSKDELNHPSKEQSTGRKEVQSGSLQQVLTPTVLLLSGLTFFLFSLILFFCSSEGVFTLHWNARLWPFYFSGSLPLLFFGWKALDKVEGDKEL